MKKILLIFLLSIGSTMYSQYNYQIVITGGNNKTILNNVFDEYETFNRYVNDTISFDSYSLIDSTYISNKCDSLGYTLEYFNKDKTLLANNYQLKNSNQDCENATMVCDATSFSGNSNGHGTQELNGSNRGCLLGNEHESSWYYVNVGTTGTLEMTISPTASDDYDWAIWGPFTEATANANCPPVSSPIRCSWAEGYGDTGMGDYWGCTFWFFGCITYGWITPTDNSEGAGGDSWVAPLNVQAGEIYILLIDNYSTSNNPFDLEWGGTAGLACVEVSLPVELLYFQPVVKDGTVVLNWATGSETNNDYFTIERSLDGYNWDPILSISGQGNIAEQTTYKLYDRVFGLSGIVYYRLSQTDYDGKREVFDIKSVFIHKKKIVKIINTLGQEVDINYKGLKIVIYDNGEQIKYK